ncbi:uncharacterized protein [Clytia hemisphaerica]|uniref:uncharacterized protein isoform X2 n=1 Tax=Clytia hemisphaerica TaxID=252671 RepID=UPI0034D3D58B
MVCEILAKQKKQDRTSILMCLMSVACLCIGHSVVDNNNGWEEIGPLWFIIVMESGGGKSIGYNYFKAMILDIYKVALEKIYENESNLPDIQDRKVLVPTDISWEKFGSIIAHNVGRVMAILDEAVSFFIGNKMMTQQWNIIDGKEFRSFLSLFGGDEIERCTVSERANHKIKSCHLSFCGFAQPIVAKAVISDTHGSMTGFPQRFLWYFAPEHFSSYNDLLLYDDEKRTLDQFRENFIGKMSEAYATKDLRSSVNWHNKMIIVDPSVLKFCLSDEAKEYHIHNYDWTEFEMMFPSGYSFVKGQFNKGRGMILRASALIEMLVRSFDERSLIPDEVNEVVEISKTSLMIASQYIISNLL